jgi:hypothetical protein
VTALSCSCILDLDPWRAWGMTPELHRRLFVQDVHGGTLVFRRSVWRDLARYPDRSLAEDAWFLAQATRRGARLERLPGRGRFVYVRHGRNAWRFAPGSYLDSDGWFAAPEPELPEEDLAFYRSRAGGARAPAEPLVTCTMPTADRRAHVATAIAYFLRQDYPRRELVVVDDGADAVADLIPDDPRVRYVRLDERLVLGEKRNRACELARGEVIVHWDDDDWQAPGRLTYQVRQLEAASADLCGTSRVLYVDAAGRSAWLYVYPEGHRRWLAGNGLCYRRSLWQRRGFPPLATGEDTRFVWSREASNALVLPDHRYFVGLVHPGNTSRKQTGGSCWRPAQVEEVRRVLGSDFEPFLAAAGGATAGTAPPA